MSLDSGGRGLNQKFEYCIVVECKGKLLNIFFILFLGLEFSFLYQRIKN